MAALIAFGISSLSEKKGVHLGGKIVGFRFKLVLVTKT
jgi:hypothetical protein